jgi:hypothetical protein
MIFYKTQDMIIFHWENQRFDSRWTNDFLQIRYLGALAIDVLIYTEKLKSKTGMRKMVKIIVELLKIRKTKKIPQMRSHPKKEKAKPTFIEF